MYYCFVINDWLLKLSKLGTLFGATIEGLGFCIDTWFSWVKSSRFMQICWIMWFSWVLSQVLTSVGQYNRVIVKISVIRIVRFTFIFGRSQAHSFKSSGWIKITQEHDVNWSNWMRIVRIGRVNLFTNQWKQKRSRTHKSPT